MKDKEVLTEKEFREAMQKGIKSLNPKIATMTGLLVDFYMRGFSDCFKLLTGKDLEEKK